MKHRGKKIYILIPAFNEEKHIGRVIRSLQAEGYNDILVVNDGSSDKTAAVAARAGAEVINHVINRGQGAALRTGIEYLRENVRPQVVATFDADGQHQAKDLVMLMEPVLEEKCDIALGSRFLTNETALPAFRKAILKAGVLFTNIVSKTSLTDTHNGLRAIGLKALDKINIRQRGMEHASEIIDEIQRHNLCYQEVAVKLIYSEYSLKKGQRSSNFWKIGLKVLIRKLAS